MKNATGLLCSNLFQELLQLLCILPIPNNDQPEILRLQHVLRKRIDLFLRDFLDLCEELRNIEDAMLRFCVEELLSPIEVCEFLRIFETEGHFTLDEFLCPREFHLC